MTDVWDQVDEELAAGPVEAPSEPVQPEPDVWAEIEQDEERARQADNTKLRTVFAAIQASPGDERLAAQQIARRTHAPLEVVQANLPAWRQAAERMEFDPDRLRKESPEIARLMLEDPDAASAVYRDEKVSDFARSFAGIAAWKAEHPILNSYMQVLTLGAATPVMGAIGAFGEAAGVETPFSPIKRREGVRYQAVEDKGTLGMVADTFSRGRKRSKINRLATKALLFDRRTAKLEEMVEEGLAPQLAVDASRRAGADIHDEIIRLQEELGLEPDYGENEIQRILVDATEGLSSQVSTIQGMVAGGVGGATVGAGAALVLTRNPATAVAAGKIVGDIGMRVGTFGASFAEEAGSQYIELLRETTDDGAPIDPDIARGAAILYGLSAAGVEMVTEFGVLLKAGPKGLLAKQGIHPLLKELGKKVAVGGVGEGFEEMIQESLGILSQWTSKSLTAGEAQSFDLTESAKQVGQAGYKGTLGGIGPAAGMAAARMGYDSAGVARSLRAGAQVAQLADVLDSPATKAVPEAVARVFEELSERHGRPMDGVYIDPVALTQAFNRAGLDPADAIAEVMGPEGAERMRLATAIRQDQDGKRASLYLPTAEFLTNWGPRADFVKQLVGDMTVVEGGWTLNEISDFERASQERQAELYEQYKAEGTWIPETEADHELVAAVEEDLRAVGRFDDQYVDDMVALVRSFVDMRAEMHGLDREGVAALGSIEVRNATAGEVQAETVTPGPEPMASRALSETLRQMMPEQRAELLYIDRNTGLLNDRGFAALPRDLSKPFVAQFSFEGVKWKNIETHTAGNLLYRAAAQALRQAAPNAAKWKGDFVAMVESAEEAERIGLEMQANLLETLREANPELADQMQGLQITQGVAELGQDLEASVDAAGQANIAEKARREALPEAEPLRRAERGARPFGLPVETPQEILLPTEEAVPRGLPDEMLEAADQLTDEQLFSEVYIEPETGHLTREGFFALEFDHVVSMDLDGLKAINEKHGYQAGNQLLAAFSKMAQFAGGSQVSFAHLSGDEYAAGTNDPELAQLYVDILATLCDTVTLKFGEETHSGIKFGYGIAGGKGSTSANYDAADALVDPHKQARKDAAANNRGDPEERARRRRFEGRRGDPRGQRRAEALRGGARPQVFAGRGRAVEGARGRGLRTAGQRLLDAVREELARRPDLTEASDPTDIGPLAKALTKAVKDGHTELARAADLATQLHVYQKEAGIVGKRQTGGVRAKVAQSIHQGIRDVMAASFPEGDWPSEKADGEYLAGKNPPPEAGGAWDRINEALEARGDQGRRVSGLAEGLDRLVRTHRNPRSWEAFAEAIEIANQVDDIKGQLRLPDEVVERMAEERASNEEDLVRQEAHEAGVEVREDAELDDDGNLVDPDTGQVLFQPTEVLFDEGPKTPRGWVKITRDAIRNTFEILLTEKADISTPLHELAHTYLEMLAELSTAPNVTDEVRAGWQRVLKYLGAKDLASINERQKEKWARAFEAYLLEGRAPSRALVETFQRLRVLLLETYGTADRLQVELDDDIRRVFDSLLATDRELEVTREAMGISAPLYTREEFEGTDEEWQAYQKYREEANVKAALQVQRDVAVAQRKVLSKEWKKQVRENREQAKQEFDSKPAFRAWRFILRGEVRTPAGDLIEDASDRSIGKINRDSVLRAVGHGHPIMNKLRGRILKKGGLDVADLAEQFGFPDAKRMLEDIVALPDRAKWVRERAEELTRDAHPELALERERINEKAAEALHSEDSVQALLREWRQDLQRAGIPGVPPLKDLEAVAKRLVDDLPHRTIRLHNTLEAERKASERRVAAVARNDWQAAAAEKKNQILAHLTYRLLSEAKRERERFEALAKKTRNVGTRKRMGAEGRGAPFFADIDWLLESLKLGKPVTDQDLLAARAETVPLSSLDERTLGENGLDMVLGFQQGLVSRLIHNPPKNGFNDLSIAEMREVHKALQQLWTAAREVGTIVVDGKRRKLNKLAHDIAREAAERSKKKPLKLAWHDTAKAKGTQPDEGTLLQRLDGMLVRVQELFRQLGDTAYNALWTNGYLPAREKANQLSEKVSAELERMWEKMPKQMRATLYDNLTDLDGVEPPIGFPRVGERNRMWMIMVALNLGNESNRERLLGGMEWDEQRVLAWLGRNMTEEEKTFVQGVWDLLDKTLWPEVKSVYTEVNGIPPAKIEATPVQIGGTMLRGGYFPAKFDPVASAVSGRMTDANLNMLFGDGRLAVNKGFVTERVQKYEDVIDLHSWGMVPGHIASVIHYVAYERFIRQAAKVVGHVAVKDAITQHLGQAYHPTIMGALKRIASHAADTLPKDLGLFYRILLGGKSRFAMATLAGSLPVFLADQLNGLMTWAMGNVSLRGLMHGYREVNPFTYRKTRERVLALSPEMRNRDKNWSRALRQQLGEMGGWKGKRGDLGKLLDGARDAAWFLMKFGDDTSATLIWTAAFDDAQSRLGMTEEQAIRHADDAVHSSLPSHDQADLPAIMGNKGAAASFVMFFGYFNTVYNANRRLFKERSVAEAFARTILMFLIANVAGELLGGRGPEEDEEWDEWALRKTLAAPFTYIPGLAGVAEWLIGAGTSKAWHGEARFRHVSVRAAPAVSTVQRLWRSAQRLIDEETDSTERIFAFLDAVGLVTYTPIGASQIQRTGKYLTSREFQRDVRQGDIPGIASGVVYGRRDRQPKNPLNILAK